MTAIVIAGYYGSGNAGDEAMLHVTLEALRRRLGAVDFTVIAAEPRGVEKTYGVPAVGTRDFGGIRRTLRGADLYLSGGGSLLQDVTSKQNMLFHLGLFWLAARAGVPSMIFAQGIGPIKWPWLWRRLAPLALRSVQAVTVRDPDSPEVLRRIGAAGRGLPEPEVTADLAFVQEPCPEARADEILREAGARRPIVAFAPREVQHHETETRSLAAMADWTVSHLKATPLLVPMQHPKDLVSCESVLDHMKHRSGAVVLRARLGPDELMGVLGRAELVVGVRLHALIFGAAQGTPVAGITYDPKVTSFLRRLGLSPLAHLTGPEHLGGPGQRTGPGREVAPDLLLGLEEAWNKREQTRRGLAGVVPGLRRLAERNFDIAAELARAGRRSAGRGGRR